MRTSILLGLVALSTACFDDTLVKTCGGSCIIIDGEILQSGTDGCTGTLRCDSDGTEHCDGYRPSTSEVCDGVDNDCDNIVDEGVDFVALQEGNPCLTAPGVCQRAQAICVGGEFHCANAPDQGLEVCDGLDNDCNGQADDGLGILGFEYNGPPETLNIGECRAGVVECVDGAPTARGEVDPLEYELCGDEKDSDCDGAANPEGGGVAHDVVLVIDYSGSMSSSIFDVIDAVCQWGDSDIAEHNFAAVSIARNASNDGSVEIVFDFEPPDQACLDLMDSTVTFGGGLEYMLDGVLLPHQAPLSFSGAAKDFIVFTDEEVQINPYTESSLADVADDCQLNDYTVTAFTLFPFRHEWSVLSHLCGGTVEDLGFAGSMRDTLLGMFGTFCSR